MKKAFVRILAIFGVIILVAVLLNIKTIQKLRHVISLFDEDKIVQNFLHMEDDFDTRTILKSPDPTVLPSNIRYGLPASFTWGDSTFVTSSYLDYVNTTGILVIHRDTIVLEEYSHGLTESGTHISWSMAKSFVSALVGIAHDDGLFESVDEPITRYLPQLKNSAYDGVSIKDVLQMSTGVGFNEDYRDFNSDINRFGRHFALGKPLEDFVLSLEREGKPGTYNHYVSINTQVLGMLVTEVTGKTLSDYLKEKIWDPVGMEFDAQWILDRVGMEMALGGLNVAMRDYAKLGLLYLHNGIWRGRQVLSESWIEASVTPDEPYLQPGTNELSDSDFGYGYQWWIPENPDGAYFAAGIYNQYIYVYPKKDLVIVKLSANHHFKEAGDQSKSIHVALLRTIAKDFPFAAKSDSSQSQLVIAAGHP